MNVSDFTYLLNHPEAVNEKRTEELDKIVAEFPYFQSARALRLKGLYNEDSFRYNYALKVTAAFTGDRSVLFDFITSDSFTSVDKHLYAQKQQELHAIRVTDSQEIVEMEEIAVDDSLRASLQTEFVPASEVRDEEIPVPEIATAASPAGDILEEVEEMDWPGIEAEHLVEQAHAETPRTQDAGQDEPESQDADIDPATKSVMDSIKEAEQYAKSLVVTGVEEVVPFTGSAAGTEAQQEMPARAEESTEAGQKLEIGKPLDFSGGETHSFHEWLQLSRLEPIVREEAAPDSSGIPDIEPESDASEEDSGRQKKNELIDKFIESNPKIPKITPETKSPSFIFEPTQPDNSYLMTETLARVYLEQKKYDKAIQAYEILILKYPEKNSFFADRILDIRNLQQNNKLQ